MSNKQIADKLEKTSIKNLKPKNVSGRGVIRTPHPHLAVKSFEKRSLWLGTPKAADVAETHTSVTERGMRLKLNVEAIHCEIPVYFNNISLV